MSNSINSSPIEAINAALSEHNPFAQPPSVVASNIWDKSFPDVESLNAHASDAVFQALEDIRTKKYEATSILITASNGTGKSHIISRIRHRLQDLGSAFFILASKFNLNQVKSSFQQLLSESLTKAGAQGTSQWQELAASMVNDVLMSKNPKAQLVEPKNLVKKFDTMEDRTKVLGLIGQLTKEFCKLKTGNDPDIVRAVFWTLVEDEAAYVSNWLAGKELAQYKANELHLPTQSCSFDTVLQILSVISEYNSLVICFDELDIAEFNDAGLRKAQVIASFVKELFENLKRGVILSVMMPGVWREEICDKLLPSIPAKMTMFSNPLVLQRLNADTTVDVVSCFLQDYYDARELAPPYPLYPFEEDKIREIGRKGLTVQEVLKWCKENCKPPIPSDASQSSPPVDPLVDPLKDVQLESVELALTNELGDDTSGKLDDNQFIAEALFFSFEHLIGQEIDHFKIQQVTTGVNSRHKRDYYLNFKVIGQDRGQSTCIGVAVLQDAGGRGLGAGFKRLLDANGEYGLTRGCLVRSKAKPLASHFHKNHVTPLVSKGGEWVDLIEQQIKPLIAIHSVYQKRESDYGVTEEDILRFINECGSKYWLGAHNPLIQEILSDPSYEVPDNLQTEPEVAEFDDFASLAPTNEADSSESTEDLAELMV